MTIRQPQENEGYFFWTRILQILIDVSFPM